MQKTQTSGLTSLLKIKKLDWNFLIVPPGQILAWKSRNTKIYISQHLMIDKNPHQHSHCELSP